MLRQIRLLVRLQQCNVFGINEVRYTRDEKKKQRLIGLGIVWLALIAMLAFYIGAMSVAFAKLGLAEIIPVYLYTLAGVVILFFSIIKAGSLMFDRRTYEMQISLPVSRTAIVASRFFAMYISNLVLGLLVMLPGLGVYAVYCHPAPFFYGYATAGILLLPMFPVTIATAVGALVTAISSRMRHKSLASAVLTLIFVILFLAGSSILGGEADQLTEEMIKNLAAVATEKMGQLYPPALWFGASVIEGSLAGFGKLAGISIGSFVVLMAVLQKFFVQICSALNANSAKNNYRMKSLTSNSVLKALWKRELKRYFASSIYVTNTMMGYLLMAVFAVALWVVGLDKIEAQLPIPEEMIMTFLPFLLSFPAVIMPVTSSSISMEGKQWWILQTLPVTNKVVYAGKILTNFLIATPFYVVTVVFALLAAKPNVWGIIGICLLPAAYIVFSATAGLTINIRMPILEWENDMQVVKQSAAALLSMLAGFVSILVPCILLGILPGTLRGFVMPVTVIVLAIISIVLYVRDCRTELIEIGQK